MSVKLRARKRFQGQNGTTPDERAAPIRHVVSLQRCLKVFSERFRRRRASSARSDPSPLAFVALVRLFAGRPLKGALELRGVRLREFCVCVPVQRDVPELPFQISSLRITTPDSTRIVDSTRLAQSVDGAATKRKVIFLAICVMNRE